MYLADIFGTSRNIKPGQLFPIRNSCSDFLRESNGQPVYKQLPRLYYMCNKVKVRHKTNPILEKYFFNNVIEDRKALVDTRTQPLPGKDNYWVFPINGYKYLYNPMIVDYKDSIKKITEQTTDSAIVQELIGDLYKHDQIDEAFHNDTEILWYKISHFYAVDCSMFQDYAELLKLL